ncbi:MAG: hypothetical protein LBN36_00675, partial [Clostridiales Family XIII bacterium]|nr:hypothetical protein [Clostridiales Family XIII bacterium]
MSKNYHKKRNHTKPKTLKRLQTHRISGVISVTRHGYGFVTPEEGGKDIFVSGRDMNGAMHGDVVDVVVLPDLRRDDKQKGRVDGILKRATEEIVGTFDRNKHFGFIVPDDKKLRDEI